MIWWAHRIKPDPNSMWVMPLCLWGVSGYELLDWVDINHIAFLFMPNGHMDDTPEIKEGKFDLELHSRRQPPSNRGQRPSPLYWRANTDPSKSHNTQHAAHGNKLKFTFLYATVHSAQPGMFWRHITPNPTKNGSGWCLFAGGEHKLD
jgi:hypothetical protein